MNSLQKLKKELNDQKENQERDNHSVLEQFKTVSQKLNSLDERIRQLEETNETAETTVTISRRLSIIWTIVKFGLFDKRIKNLEEKVNDKVITFLVWKTIQLGFHSNRICEKGYGSSVQTEMPASTWGLDGISISIIWYVHDG